MNTIFENFCRKLGNFRQVRSLNYNSRSFGQKTNKLNLKWKTKLIHVRNYNLPIYVQQNKIGKLLESCNRKSFRDVLHHITHRHHNIRMRHTELTLRLLYPGVTFRSTLLNFHHYHRARLKIGGEQLLLV